MIAPLTQARVVTPDATTANRATIVRALEDVEGMGDLERVRLVAWLDDLLIRASGRPF